MVRFSWKAMWMSNKGKMNDWAVMFIPNPIAMFVIDSSREWVLDCISLFYHLCKEVGGWGIFLKSWQFFHSFL